MALQNSKTISNYNLLERNIVFYVYHIKEVDFLILKITPMNSLELFENYLNPSLKPFTFYTATGKIPSTIMEI